MICCWQDLEKLHLDTGYLYMLTLYLGIMLLEKDMEWYDLVNWTLLLVVLCWGWFGMKFK